MIVLIGYMGSGKSSVSKYLSKKYNLSHCDLDDYIENQEGFSISEIFTNKGEIYFRKKENEYLKKILSNDEYDLISLGGGTPCYANNMELIKHFKAKSFYLKVKLEELTKRLFLQKSERPLISGIQDREQLKDFIRKHIFEREYYYRQADFTLDITSLNIEEVAKQILNI